MTPQQFVEWGRRIADGYAASASQLNPRSSEFDDDSMAADDFLNKSNQLARAFTISGGQETLALAPALLQLQSPDSEQTFKQVFQSLQPVLYEILDGMWLGEWDFNDSGLAGMLKIDRESTPGKGPFRALYIDSRGTSHETVVTREDQEYGMSYESLHLEVNYPSFPAWKIHAFIFRWDRKIMAGIVDDGETEGRHSFYAVKKVRQVPPPLPPQF
jgi:hypothetical protein